MINPSDLQIGGLPSVALEDRKQLPFIPCFALSGGVVQLDEVEQALIEWFVPHLNGVRAEKMIDGLRLSRGIDAVLAGERLQKVRVVFLSKRLPLFPQCVKPAPSLYC